MLCHLCEAFLSNILHQDFSTWRRVKDGEGWFTFKHGNYATVTAAAESGCELCALFNQVRGESSPNYESLGEKWHVQAASIDIMRGFVSGASSAKDLNSQLYANWTFHLLTVAPEMSWIAFELFAPDSNGQQDDRSDALFSAWAREVSRSPTAARTLGLAKKWIDTCLGDHATCVRPDRAPLPTRVIDVGYSGGPPNPRLIITRGQLGRYVTLSHCWGTSNRVTLTKRNLHESQQAISFKQLPKTFQDAIQLTMLLNIRYLWIDALCIVQDDREDWRKEAASMGAVFENAVFSISAMSATDSHSGILHDRELRQIVAKINGVELGIRKRLDSLAEAMQKSTLETRAWCYQERLLPKAILHVGLDQAYWECRESTSSESSPKEISARGTGWPSGDIENQPIEDAFGKHWLRIVTNYSARSITRASDRLPAIGGLADKARKESGNAAYLQGLWSHDLHAGLLWRRPTLEHGRVVPSRDKYYTRSSSRAAERPQRQIASSWSWASINRAVKFETVDQYSVRSPSNSDAIFDRYETTENKVPDRSRVKLQLEGLVKRGYCKLASESTQEPDEGIFRPSGSVLAGDGLKCYIDYAQEPVSKTCYCLRIAKFRRNDSKSSNRRKRQDQAFYLLLERTEDGLSDQNSDRETFGILKRIGMGFDESDKVEKIFANAERRRLQLV